MLATQGLGIRAQKKLLYIFATREHFASCITRIVDQALHFLSSVIFMFSFQCMQNGWYLACDMQLYILSLGLITLMWFMQNRIKSILLISLVIAILIPASITYYHNLMPTFLNYPETLRQVFYNDDTFFYTYIRSFTNFGAYIVGMITAYLIYTGKIQAGLNLSPFVSKTL